MRDLPDDLRDLATGRDLVSGEAPCPGPVPGEPGSDRRLGALATRYERRERFWPAMTGGPDDAGASLARERIAAMLGDATACGEHREAANGRH